MARRQSDEGILSEARKRFKLCEDAERDLRKEALDDLRFVSGVQWDDADRRSRTTGLSSRPCLSFNKLIGPLNMAANEARMNQAGIKVYPVDSTSDPDTAKVIEGMIRHIEDVCKADEVYESALEQSTACGFGFFKVTTRYCGPKSFDQELRIERIPDQFSVYIDPYAREADKADMAYAFEVEVIPRDEYEADYGDSQITSLNFYEGLSNPVPDWITKSGVRIARYWTVETKKRTLTSVEWPDGTRTSQYKDEIPDAMPQGLKIATGPDGKPLERETEQRVVRWRKINGIEILDEGEWPGQWIPILPVLGKEMWVDGVRKLFSLIRFAKDPQRLYNFYRSSEAETVLLGTKAPWIGVKGAFRDNRWASANTTNYAYLEYEPVDIAGNPAPPPQRNVFEPPIQALSLGAAQASDDIKATTGIFDASLGAQSNETSGIAIRQRQSQAGLANAHFIDNLNRAIRQCGVILTDLIPKIYDMPREVRILGEDRAQQIVKVNQQFQEWNGQIKCYDLASGQYDVVASAGPTSITQRQETWETLTQLAQAYPQLLQIAGDILFDNADFPGADKLADRLRKTLPPGLQDQPGNAQQQMQMLAAQYQQSQAMIQQLTQALQSAQQKIDTKEIETKSDEREAALKAQVDLITGIAKGGAPESLGVLTQQVALAEAMIGRMFTGSAGGTGASPAGTPAAPSSPGMAPPAPPGMMQ
ncbi:MAG TPA: portal protein [Bryobacteraceae bacterium]|nr:portal protein [Bryobacteraceae bacterium]